MEVSHTLPHCGIILAGGEGERLRPFIRQLRGSVLPKQYVNFIGTRSMLEHTFHRTEKLIPPERLFTVVSRNHLSYPEVRQQLSSRWPGTVVVQPVNKETGPGILLPLMHIYKRYPQSVVAVFPSDHFIVEEELFMAHVDLAFSAVEQNPSCLVLLGVQSGELEPEYGYISAPGSGEFFQRTVGKLFHGVCFTPDGPAGPGSVLERLGIGAAYFECPRNVWLPGATS